MATPAIQTLLSDAQQVLNLNSISEVRSTMAVALANANIGTPLSPSLTTQQLWDEFYQVVRQPESDIESILANQLMKFLYAPPAPGGVGADKQVIFNDGGVLAGSANFLFNKATNLLTVTGSATITGDLTVKTNVLKVDTTNNRVGIGTASPDSLLQMAGAGTINWKLSNTADSVTVGCYAGTTAGTTGTVSSHPFFLFTNNTERYRLASDGVATWSNVGGVAGTAMTLNSTGLGVGASPNQPIQLSKSNTSTALTAPPTGGASLRIQNTSSTNNNFGSVEFYNAAGLFGASINCQYTNQATPTNDLVFVVRGSGGGIEAARIDSSGNVGIGVTPAGTGGCLQLKSGITFPATQVASSDANTLDDYEEGTWSPVITAGSGTPTTVTVNSAVYTKIGRVVVCTFDISIVNKGTASSSLQFGLPFNSITSTAFCGSFREDGSTGNMGMVFYSTGTTAACLLYNNATPWVDGYRLKGTYTYFAA